MYRAKALLLLAVVVAAVASRAHAETEVRVLATYPAGDSVILGNHQKFYLRFSYTADEAIRIWARPYFQGREVKAGSNPSGTYTGSGEALGWFFLMDAGEQVDEVRITAGDGSEAGTRLVATHKVHISGSGRPPAATREPDWVATLTQQDERLRREELALRRSMPTSPGETLLVSGFMLAAVVLAIGGVAAPLWAIRRWRGGWRVAAAVPAVMIGFVGLRILVDTAADPTSHNLWPFEILRVGALSLVVIGVLLAARRLSGPQA